MWPCVEWRGGGGGRCVGGVCMVVVGRFQTEFGYDVSYLFFGDGNHVIDIFPVAQATEP